MDGRRAAFSCDRIDRIARKERQIDGTSRRTTSHHQIRRGRHHSRRAAARKAQAQQAAQHQARRRPHGSRHPHRPCGAPAQAAPVPGPGPSGDADYRRRHGAHRRPLRPQHHPSPAHQRADRRKRPDLHRSGLQDPRPRKDHPAPQLRMAVQARLLPACSSSRPTSPWPAFSSATTSTTATATTCPSACTNSSTRSCRPTTRSSSRPTSNSAAPTSSSTCLPAASSWKRWGSSRRSV